MPTTQASETFYRVAITLQRKARQRKKYISQMAKCQPLSMKLFGHNVLTLKETANTLSIIRIYQVIAKFFVVVQNTGNELLLAMQLSTHAN